MEALLVHYSKHPVREVYPVEQRRPADKPNGFWVSVEDGEGWRDWCLANDFRLEGLAHRHEITLTPDARILRVTSTREFDAFHARFCAPAEKWWQQNRRIQWHLVAERWQGIIIAPYQWGRRLCDETRWYYGWDCSSGCIWDPKAIQSITVQEAEAA